MKQVRHLKLKMGSWLPRETSRAFAAPPFEPRSSWVARGVWSRPWTHNRLSALVFQANGPSAPRFSRFEMVLTLSVVFGDLIGWVYSLGRKNGQNALDAARGRS